MSKSIKLSKTASILCLFDYKTTTGFGTVSHNIVRELRKRFGDRLVLDICAINWFGTNPGKEDNVSLIYPDKSTMVFSALMTDPREDPFGRYIFLKMLKEGNYDGIFIMQDIGIIAPIIPVLETIKQEKRQEKKLQFKSVFYFPIDNVHPLPEWFKGLDFFDVVVTYTEFGRKAVTDIRPDLKTKVEVIPHGNNNKDYFTIPDAGKVEEFRTKYFGAKNFDKFIVTCVNRNQPRKDISTTITGFWEYWKQFNRKSFLYLNMNPKDPLGNDLRVILRQTGLQEFDDYMFPIQDKENHGLTNEELNLVYNASDVFLTTTTGGGWELTVTEAMAAGLPVIAPHHTSLSEIGANGRITYLEEFDLRAGADNILRPHCIADEVAEKLDQIHKESMALDGELSARIDKARRFAQGLSWTTVCERWYYIFRNTFL